MARCRSSRSIFPTILFAIFAVPFHGSLSQVPEGMVPPNSAANAVIRNMYVPTTPGEPFSGRSVATLTQVRHGTTVRFGFISLVARDSTGKLYFENRRPLTSSGEAAPRTYFIVIDPGEHTRTMCYVATKSCRINTFRHVTQADPGTDETNAPAAATSKKISLGNKTIDTLTVVGTRETTLIAVGAYGNQRPFVTEEEIWHSPELDLDVSIVRHDPRSGDQTRDITEISRGEPDPEYFSIPPNYKLLDNRGRDDQ
jgi:hypothetical protein